MRHSKSCGWIITETLPEVRQSSLFLMVRSFVRVRGKVLLTGHGSVQFSRSVVPDSLRPHEFAARQASLSITNSWSSLRLTSIKSVMPSSHLILGHPLLLLPPSRKHKSEQENVFACQSGTILMFDKIKSGELVGEEVHLIHSWNGYTLTWLF